MQITRRTPPQIKSRLLDGFQKFRMFWKAESGLRVVMILYFHFGHAEPCGSPHFRNSDLEKIEKIMKGDPSVQHEMIIKQLRGYGICIL